MSKKEEFKSFQISNVTIPVITSLDDLPFDTVLRLTEIQFEAGLMGSEVTPAIYGIAKNYVEVYAEAVGSPIEFDALPGKQKVANECVTAFTQLFAHFQAPEVDGESDPKNVAASKSEAPKSS